MLSMDIVWEKKGKTFSVAVVGNDLNSSELIYFIPDSK